MRSPMLDPDGPMDDTVRLLDGLGLPAGDAGDLPSSSARFDDREASRVPQPTLADVDQLLDQLRSRGCDRRP